MKSSLGKLKKIAMNKSEPKENWNQHISVHTEGLSQAAKDMKEMRTCYDSLLSAAAASANSAHEFSESLLEMGSCLLDKTAKHEDGESGGTLSRLGRVQLELRKLVDIYRSHIVNTITNPSESLLGELWKVEEMKLQCDEKRDRFEYMVGQLKEKGKTKHGKVETFTSQHVQAVCEEYNEAARLCVFRVESLKQGQCRSLLTQAARHHAAQLNFFRKGLQSLEAVEPHVKIVADSFRIDYELCDLNDGEEVDYEGNSSEANDDGELSFDFRQNRQDLDIASRNSMELDQVVAPTPQRRAGSHSAPLNVEKHDPSERIREMRNAVQKLNTHVLPTPADAMGSKASAHMTPSNTTMPGKSSKTLWHSSPLDTEKHKKFSEEHMSASSISKPLVVEESSDKHFFPLPLPLIEGASVLQLDAQSGVDNQKIKRLAFSGPLASKPTSNKLHLFSAPPVSSTEQPQSISGLLSRGSSAQPPPSTLNVPHNSTIPSLSSPKISELHELPRPPDSLSSNPFRSSGIFGHSAPLVSKNREVSPTFRNPSLPSKQGSPLPRPHLNVSRSFNVRYSSRTTIPLHAGKVVESSHNMDEITSPPLTPISLSNTKSLNFG